MRSSRTTKHSKSKAEGEAGRLQRPAGSDSKVSGSGTGTACEQLITNLRHARTGDRERRERLAERLEACTRRHPCNSGACPRCGERHKRAMVRAVERLWPDEPLEIVSIIPVWVQRPLGDLDTLKLPSVKAHL